LAATCEKAASLITLDFSQLQPTNYSHFRRFSVSSFFLSPHLEQFGLGLLRLGWRIGNHLKILAIFTYNYL
jgi:hypothetical protein